MRHSKKDKARGLGRATVAGGGVGHNTDTPRAQAEDAEAGARQRTSWVASATAKSDQDTRPLTDKHEPLLARRASSLRRRRAIRVGFRRVKGLTEDEEPADAGPEDELTRTRGTCSLRMSCMEPEGAHNRTQKGEKASQTQEEGFHLTSSCWVSGQGRPKKSSCHSVFTGRKATRSTTNHEARKRQARRT